MTPALASVCGSAHFEVLFHPGANQRVNKRVVQVALQAVPWTRRELSAMRYKVTYNQMFKATLAEAIYDDLYHARNRFLHGQPVTATDLYYRQSNRFRPILELAPVLYNAALLAYLRGKIPGGPDQFKLSAEYFAGLPHWHRCRAGGAPCGARARRYAVASDPIIEAKRVGALALRSD